MSGPYPFGKRSLAVRDELHPDLQKVVDEASKEINCSLICGYRGKEDQDKAYSEGKSKLKYPNSRHNSKPSEAVDMVPFPCDWRNIRSFKEMAIAVKEAAKRVDVEIEWGGDFKTLVDMPHFQLKKK